MTARCRIPARVTSLLIAILIAVCSFPVVRAAAGEYDSVRAALESEYGITVEMKQVVDSETSVHMIYKLRDALYMTPPGLLKAMTDLKRQSGVETAVIFGEPVDFSELADAEYDIDKNAVTLFGFDTASYDDSLKNVCHEFGHMLYYLTVGESDGLALENKWISFNGAVKYGSEIDRVGEYDPVFATEYGSSELIEDFAEVFALMTAGSERARELFRDYPGSPLAQKCELAEKAAAAFSVEEFCFPRSRPELPHDWAVPGISSASAWTDVNITLFRSEITRGEFARLIAGAVSFLDDGATRPLTRQKDNRGAIVFVRDNSDWSLISYAESPFKDYPDDADILGLYSASIIQGDNNLLFNSLKGITRQEAALILARAAEHLGVPGKTVNLDKYSDVADIADWAASGVSAVAGLEIMTGMSAQLFDPLGGYTVEQAIVSVDRLVKAAQNARTQ